jgi:hypothetical protein
MFESFEKLARDESSQALSLLGKCKALARKTKARRDRSSLLGQPEPASLFPGKDVADTLVDGYMWTTESVYRVLHIPSFMADYATFWTDPASLSPAVSLQIKLVCYRSCLIR